MSPSAQPDMSGLQTFPEVLAALVASHPDREAVVGGALRLSYADLAELADRCARALTARGIGPGDRVGVFGPVCPEVVVLFLACARIGAMYLGMGTRLREADLEHLYRDAEPSLVFALAEDDGRPMADGFGRVAAATGGPSPLLLTLVADGLTPEFADLLDQAPQGGNLPELPGPDDDLTIVYTSGTTGPPKGAVLGHRYLLSCRALLERWPVPEAPRMLSLMPIDHIGFLVNELTACLLTGGTMVQLPRFDAAAVAQAIERERVTFWSGAIPTMLTRLVDLPGLAGYDLSTLRALWWTGQVSARVAGAIAAIVPQLGSSYGMTEAGSITMTDPGVPLAVCAQTVGRPLAGVRIRVVGPDGADAAAGSVGEVLVAKDPLMNRYHRLPGPTAATIDPGGWLHTGDLGFFDADGNLTLTGRAKLLIRTGGYNVSPFEVESVLETHPAVAMAIVVPVPDEVYGETVHAAWVPLPGVPEPGEEELRKYARARLSGYKVPKRFRRLAELPLLANGKANRTSIRQLMAGAPSASGRPAAGLPAPRTEPEPERSPK